MPFGQPWCKNISLATERKNHKPDQIIMTFCFDKSNYPNLILDANDRSPLFPEQISIHLILISFKTRFYSAYITELKPFFFPLYWTINMRQTKLRIVYWPSKLPYFKCTHGKQFYQTSEYSLSVYTMHWSHQNSWWINYQPKEFI